MKLWNRVRSATGVASCVVVTAILLAAGSVQPALACRTPVYRYAIYNWPTAPYYVFYFHHGEISEQDEAANKLLKELAEADPPANVLLEVVDAREEEQLERLPQVVTKTYESHAEGTTPLHLIFAPWPSEPFVQRLDVDTVRKMVDSPARKRLAELLHQGNAVVLLSLTGPDEQTNKRAEKVVGQAMEKVNSGEIPLGPDAYGPMAPAYPMPDTDDDPDSDDEPEEPSSTFKVAGLKVRRTDPAEKALVEMLLTVEPDLREPKFADEVMVFAVYGRGRAMPPYLGKGITEENLIDCLGFLSGPCSCQIKGYNPGVDLLMKWDWDATAEAIAAKDPEFAGGPFGYYEFEPEVAEGAAEGPSAEELVTEVAGRVSQTVTAAAGRLVQAVPREAKPLLSGRWARASWRPRAEIAENVHTPETVESDGETRPEGPSFAARQAWLVGIGLAAATVVLLAVGVVFVRRRRPG